MEVVSSEWMLGFLKVTTSLVQMDFGLKCGNQSFAERSVIQRTLTASALFRKVEGLSRKA